jgi:2-keto-4-pentenoate hydratase/2-oxohepta-3-ene-1,7-dioic acid hydratase in catechol pathway
VAVPNIGQVVPHLCAGYALTRAESTQMARPRGSEEGLQGSEWADEEDAQIGTCQRASGQGEFNRPGWLRCLYDNERATQLWVAQTHPRFLNEGDVVTVSISGIGDLTNPVTAEGSAA